MDRQLLYVVAQPLSTLPVLTLPTAADATIKIWAAETGEYSQTLSGHLAGISTLAWSPDSETLASGSDDKSIRLWDVFSVRPPSPNIVQPIC